MYYRESNSSRFSGNSQEIFKVIVISCLELLLNNYQTIYMDLTLTITRLERVSDFSSDSFI